MSVWSDNITVDSSALPSGAATDASVQALTKPTDTQLVDGSAHTQPVSGPLTDTQLRASAVPVSGPLTDTQLRATPVPVSATITPTVSSSATVTQVTSTGSNQTILASNASRKRAVLFFESGIWHVKFGATASASSKTYLVNSSNTAIEVPIWTGQIDALCTTSGKLVNVTEMV